MCGICGFTGEVIDRDKVIKNMTDVITHRGPDSDGVFMDDHIADFHLLTLTQVISRFITRIKHLFSLLTEKFITTES